MAETTSRDSGPTPAEAAARAVTDDPVTAELLKRHAAKEKLTPSEYGKIGAFAKAKQFIFGKPGAPGGSSQPGASPGNAPPVASLEQTQTPGAGLAPVEIDAGLCQRTVAAILNRTDAFAVQWIEREARAAAKGIDPVKADPLIDRFRSAAALPVADKKLLIEISPDVFQELGWDPRKFALWTAVGVLGLHTVNLWQTVQELRDMKTRDVIDVKSEVVKPPASTSGPARPAETAPKPAVDPGGQTIVKFPSTS